MPAFKRPTQAVRRAAPALRGTQTVRAVRPAKRGNNMKLKTAGRGAAKLMPLHQRIATGNKPIKKPGSVKK
jgi:hypothetical protein